MVCICECEKSGIVRYITAIHQQWLPLIFGFYSNLLKERISSAGGNHRFRNRAAKTWLKGCGTSMRLPDRILEKHWTLQIIIGANYSDECFECGEVLVYKKLLRFSFQSLSPPSARTVLHNFWD